MKDANTRGFTLIELLVTIAIIGVLASVILPALNGARDKARVAATQAELQTIQQAITVYYDDTSEYPNTAASYCRADPGGSNEVDLNATAAGLVADNSVAGWDGPYIESALDPWGNPYYLDEDYQCLSATTGCQDIDDPSSSDGSSVIVSCGPNEDLDSGACAYDADNIVLRLCDT